MAQVSATEIVVVDWFWNDAPIEDAPGLWLEFCRFRPEMLPDFVEVMVTEHFLKSKRTCLGSVKLLVFNLEMIYHVSRY